MKKADDRAPLPDVHTLKELYERRGGTIRGLAMRTGYSQATIRRRLVSIGVVFKSTEQRIAESAHSRAILPVGPVAAMAADDNVRISSAACIAVPFLMIPERQWSARDLARATGYSQGMVKKHLRSLVVAGDFVTFDDGANVAGQRRNLRYAITAVGIDKLSPCVMHSRNSEFRVKVSIIARSVNRTFQTPTVKRSHGSPNRDNGM